MGKGTPFGFKNLGLDQEKKVHDKGVNAGGEIMGSLSGIHKFQEINAEPGEINREAKKKKHRLNL